jgi:non-specific serine/threonine protein kinase
MRWQLGLMPELSAEDGPVPVDIKRGQWLNELRGRLQNPSQMENISSQLGEDFKAALRGYQQDGLTWLHNMRGLGFGALLADDMGLGKTVQILALLEYLRTHGGAKTLLIIPASLLQNWQREAERFTPALTLRIIHTQSKIFSLEEADLFITTYGMTTRLPSLLETEWDLVVLDEAQAVKNPSNKQTKAVSALKARSRIAMTGTPIENHLSDLWSLFDYLNKGLLGTRKEFTAFTKGLREDLSGYAKLRDIVSPFILRRLKTDKTVISDLPDKLEVNAFTTLTNKQAVLYDAMVKDLAEALKDASGISRKGLVLAGIMKCKQICNHPDQYLGQPAFEGKYSGKFEKLSEICETIREKRERVLVFTQFKEMTKPIADYLETIFGREGLVLHGQTPVKKRGELVERFNGETYVPFMVLSLKAGGVGLNLTAANHVIHFDRWWNPAVENQATDRAFRIGQQKNVMVHKFITPGTIEEKIDALLMDKQKMADDVIAQSGETWITEMSNEELMNLFALEGKR